MPLKTRAAASRTKRLPKKRRGPLRWLVRLLALWVLLVGAGSAVFVGTRCYSRNVSPSATLPPIAADDVPGYLRAEALTFLTLPERYIVYSADEYAAHLAQRPPSAFPYIGSARQYWRYYSSVCAATRQTYAFDADYHMMLGVIGASFTLESTFKALYENTMGRLTELVSGTDTPEDAFARRTAAEYGTFMHTLPWYEFPFASKLAALWRETPLRGPHTIRKIERRLALTAEYGGKALYGSVMRMASGAAHDAEDGRIHAQVDNASEAIFKDPRITHVKTLGSGAYLVSLPRYEEFTRTALALTALGVRFVDIAGNDEILISVVARRGMPAALPGAVRIAAEPVLTDPTSQRLAFKVPVASIRDISEYVAREHATIEHLYDY